MNHKPATLTLTVSPPDTSEEVWRIQIPMETIKGSLLNSILPSLEPSTPSSSSGMSPILELLQRRVAAVDLKSIHDMALSGTYDQPPIEVALHLMREVVLGIIKETLNGSDQS